MAIYTCPKCGNKYYLDNKDIESTEFQRDFHCSSCGASYNDIIEDTVSPKPKSESFIGNQATSAIANNTYEGTTSTVGSAIKGLSIIVLVLCVIGSIIAFNESIVIGLAILVVSALSCLLSYGIGEIICILKEIKNKLK